MRMFSKFVSVGRRGGGRPRCSSPAPRPPRPSSSGRTSTRPASRTTSGRCGRPTRSRSAPTASYEITVFPASSLGKEADINQGLSLGTVDMIISGTSFAARSYPRIGIAYYPFIFRDADHLLAYSKSPVFKEMVDGYPRKDRHPDHRDDVLRRAADHVEPAVHRLRRDEGPEDPRARRRPPTWRRRSPAAPTRRRSPSPRSTSRCRTAPSRRRRTR